MVKLSNKSTKKVVKFIYFIFIYMKDIFVTIKIRKEFRDMLKTYSKSHGYKMYGLIEEMIKNRCTKKILLTNQK